MAIADTDMSLIGPRMYRNAACACRNSNGGKFDWRRGRRVRVPNQGDFVQINAENRHGDTRVTLSNTIGSSGTFCNGIWPLSVLPTALPVGVNAMKSTMRMP